MNEAPSNNEASSGMSALDDGLGAWRPIATAPHDGTIVDLLGENGKLDIGEWHEWSEHLDKAAMGIPDDVTGEFSTEYGEGPHTHWRPLNAPNTRLQDNDND